jgi:diguanylate cyclase (GGDEF)-like protein
MILYRGFGVRRFANRLEEISPAAAVAAAAGIVVGVAALDHATGGLSLTDLYLLACFLGAWRVGIVGGLAVTALCGAAMLATDRLLGYTATIHLWNRAVQVSLLGVVSVLISVLKRSYAALQLLAKRDSLTGLDNRQAFVERAELELAISRREGTPFTVAYMDLDDFKAVNDAFGHAEGDRALRAVGDVLKRRVRAADACARLGGDEFAVLLRGAAPEAAVRALEQLRAELQAEMGRNGWRVGFSTGAVTLRSFDATLDDALRIADGLMYQAKRSQKGSLRHEAR